MNLDCEGFYATLQAKQVAEGEAAQQKAAVAAALAAAANIKASAQQAEQAADA